MDAFFTAKIEMYYLTGVLDTLVVTLNQLTAQADGIVRQQGGPALTVAVLEERKRELLEPFESFNRQQVTLRWNQYEQKAKETHAKAELSIATLRPLIPPALHAEMVVLFDRLSQPFVWDLPHGRQKLKLLEDSLPDVLRLREGLMAQVGKKVGKKD